MPFSPNKHCSHCGTILPLGNDWPKTCPACTQITWNNPTPVAVLLQWVDKGVLAIRRRNNPGAGKIALVGGYVDHKEDAQDTVRRERAEETGIHINDDPLLLLATRTTDDNNLLIFFGSTLALHARELPPFVPNAEVSERLIIRQPIEMAFPLHTEMLARFMTGNF